MFDPRAGTVAAVEKAVGRHDQPALYDGPRGDPGLCGGPGSISWEVNGDFASIATGGLAAIIMELLHPSVMAGVAEHSVYRTMGQQRARNTLGFVLGSTFGATDAATALIGRVRRAHTRITGERPDGQPYRALDPDLLAWVHATIPWAIMEAFHRYRRPLSADERDRYLAEVAPVGRLMGAEEVPTSMAELHDYVERTRPSLAMTDQTSDFLDYIVGDRTEGPSANPLKQLEGRLDVAGAMMLMPAWARKLSGTHQPWPVQLGVLEPRVRLKHLMISWAYPAPPCVAMAERRAAATGPADADVA